LRSVDRTAQHTRNKTNR